MPKRFAMYGAAIGFLIAVVPVTLEEFFPVTGTLLDRLPQWLWPLGSADLTSASWWSIMLWAAMQNGALYAVIGLVMGLIAAGVRRLVSRHRANRVPRRSN